MRRHGDPETREVCSVTVTRSEWLAAPRRSRRTDHGRRYLRVRCPTLRKHVLVRAIVVEDGAPEARPCRARR